MAENHNRSNPQIDWERLRVAEKEIQREHGKTGTDEGLAQARQNLKDVLHIN